MTTHVRSYELWDTSPGNCTGVYATMDAALDIVAHGVAGMSRAEAEAWIGEPTLLIYDTRQRLR